MRQNPRDLLSNALNSIINTRLLVHFIAYGEVDDVKLECVLSYNNNSRKYDFIMRVNDGEEEQHFGRDGMTLDQFMSEGIDDIFHLIEVINPVNRTSNIIYTTRNRQRNLPTQRQHRRN